MAINTESFDFDPDYLRKKYREERDKRLRQDGNEQYQEVSGEFSYFVEDPYIDDAIERERPSKMKVRLLLLVVVLEEC